MRTPPRTLERARSLRVDQTDAERCLWKHLKRNQIDELKFKRQHPIEGLIADFCCIERRLVIELDGGQHGEPSGMAGDLKRTRALERAGFRVMRFWDNEVLRNIEGVLAAIESSLKAPSPQPSPSFAGRGSKGRSPWNR